MIPIGVNDKLLKYRIFNFCVKIVGKRKLQKISCDFCLLRKAIVLSFCEIYMMIAVIVLQQ